MAPHGDGAVYEKLGVRPFITGSGHGTAAGGRHVRAVQEAIDSAGLLFVDTVELQTAAGEYIADLLGVEAALPTPGCAAAVMFSAAGCIAGDDPEKQRRIPDTTGMKNEPLLQRPQANAAHRMYEVPGATVAYAGGENACTADELAEAIGPSTAAVAYEVRPTWGPGVMSVPEVVDVAHRQGVPVIVDAASQSDPPDYLLQNARSADLVCFGAKYFGGPNNAGFVCGDKDHVAAAAAHNFMSEAHDQGFMPWGRGHKLDRIAIVATVAALEAWLKDDHEDRVLEYRRRASVIEEALRGTSGVTIEPSENGNTVDLHLAPSLGKTAQQVADELKAGEPRIKLATADDALSIHVYMFNEGDDRIVADRLRAVLTA